MIVVEDRKERERTNRIASQGETRNKLTSSRRGNGLTSRSARSDATPPPPPRKVPSFPTLYSYWKLVSLIPLKTPNPNELSRASDPRASATSEYARRRGDDEGDPITVAAADSTRIGSSRPRRVVVCRRWWRADVGDDGRRPKASVTVTSDWSSDRDSRTAEIAAVERLILYYTVVMILLL